MLKGLKKKREHIQIMSRLDTLDSLTSNKNVVIFGDQGNNLMSSLESFKMVYNKWTSYSLNLINNFKELNYNNYNRIFTYNLQN